MQFGFKGIAKTSRDLKHRYSGEQQFFHYVRDLFGKKGNGLVMEMEANEYVYSFEYELPSNLPYSTEGKYGEIYYLIKVSLDIPHQLDKEIRFPVTVIRYEDLNTKPLLKYPKREETTKTYCFFWMCCLESSPLLLKATIPYSGFTPGQKVPISIEFNNQSHVNVKCTKITLKGLHTFHFEYPSNNKHIEKYRLDYKLAMGCQAKKSIKLDEFLRVPEMLNPSNEDTCRVFQISYVIKIAAIVDDPHTNLFVYIPITIGSFPLIFKGTSQVDENTTKIFNANPNSKQAQTLYNEVIRMNEL